MTYEILIQQIFSTNITSLWKHKTLYALDSNSNKATFRQNITRQSSDHALSTATQERP